MTDLERDLTDGILARLRSHDILQGLYTEDGVASDADDVRRETAKGMAAFIMAKLDLKKEAEQE